MSPQDTQLSKVLRQAKAGLPLAIVTGAAGSIGAATANKLSEEGYAVIAADLDLGRLSQIFAEQPNQIAGVEFNVALAASWERLAIDIEAEVGRLNVLVNNAGTLQKPFLVENCPEEEFRRVLDVNLMGTYLGIKSMTPLLRKARGASIINVSSAEAFKTTPMCGAYSASKFAVRGLTKTVAVELAASGIRCNSIHPWAIDSPMARGEDGSSTFDAVLARVPMRRAGSGSEAAELVAFLAGPKSSFSTGAEFIIDGGHLAWSGY